MKLIFYNGGFWYVVNSETTWLIFKHTETWNRPMVSNKLYVNTLKIWIDKFKFSINK